MKHKIDFSLLSNIMIVSFGLLSIIYVFGASTIFNLVFSAMIIVSILFIVWGMIYLMILMGKDLKRRDK